jgi:hypothetical protein
VSHAKQDTKVSICPVSTLSSSFCCLLSKEPQGGIQSLMTPTSFCRNSAFFISQLCQCITSKGHGERNHTAQVPTALSCLSGEEKREIKANKKYKSKIPKPTLSTQQLSKSTQELGKGGNTTQIKNLAAVESALHKPSPSAGPRAS